MARFAAPRFTADPKKPESSPVSLWQATQKQLADWTGLSAWRERAELRKKLLQEASAVKLSPFLEKSGEPLIEKHPLIQALSARKEWGEDTLKQLLHKMSQAVLPENQSYIAGNLVLGSFCKTDLPALIRAMHTPKELERALGIIQKPSSFYDKIGIANRLTEARNIKIPGYWNSVALLLEQDAMHYTLMNTGPMASHNVSDIGRERWPKFAKLLETLAQKSPESLKSSGNILSLFMFLKQPATEPHWQKTADALMADIEKGENIYKQLNLKMLEWASQQNGVSQKDWLDDFLKDLSASHTHSTEFWHFGEMQKIMTQGKHLKFAVLYHQITHHDPDAFITFLPHLMLTLPPKTINQFMNHLEYKFERANPAKGHHPNEAEMLMMLRHPQDPKRENAGQTVSTLTSIYKYLSHSIHNIPDRLTKVWSDAGFLTNSFRFWRYDSQGGDKSLLAQYGFKRMAPRKTDAVYGSGFVLTKSIAPQAPLDDQTLVEFRRAYLLVSHPKHGTLMIRNSSREFGRDTMQHPAYYSRRALTSTELKTFDINTQLAPWPPLNPYKLSTENEDPDPLEGKFLSLLDPRLYPSRVTPVESGKSAKREIQGKSIQPVETLMQELLKVKEDYRRWKFDTGAFKDKVFVGQESPGFRSVLDMVGHWSDSHELGLEKVPSPELGFVHPQYPPWETYRYKDRHGQEHRTFKLTPEHVRELSRYVQGKLTDEELQQSDWYRFLKTGIRNRAELIMLAPESDTPTPKEITHADSKPA